MKKLIGIILFISILLLSSCSVLNEGICTPSTKTDHIFENDMWLVVEDLLINKIDGTVYWLELNRDAPLPAGVAEFYGDGMVVYDCEFEESAVKLHTFLRYGVYGSVYHECILTFDYEGKEIDRFYVGIPLSREEAQKLYQEKTRDTEAFLFYVIGGGYGYINDRFASIAKEYANTEKQAILNFAEDLHESQSNGDYYIMYGMARPMGDEIWFSTSGSDRRDSVKADPLISGIRENQITAYNRETNEFRTVFEYDKKRMQIVDFDENGVYILDSNGKFGYVDFETKKLTKIYEFPNIDSIVINDKYFCVKYVRNGRSYFVYEKGGAVIANDSSLD